MTKSSTLPKKIIIEEEIVDENEGPRILYPSNYRAISSKALPTSSQRSPSQSDHVPKAEREISPTESSPVNNVPLMTSKNNQSEDEYKYNLIIDEVGTRWMPVPDGASDKSQAPRKQVQTGGYLGETSEGVIQIISRESDAAPDHLFFENIPPHPMKSVAKLAAGVNSAEMAPPSTTSAPNQIFEDQYRELPLRRGEAPLTRGKEESWGGDRYVAPYISRVKIHSKYDEESPESSIVEGDAIGSQNEFPEKILLPSQPTPPDTQQQLIQLLSLLVTTQQQTLQVSPLCASLIYTGT